ncbi:hypothetical protein D3C86_2132790 [compost metagenome]
MQCRKRFRFIFFLQQEQQPHCSRVHIELRHLPQGRLSFVAIRAKERGDVVHDRLPLTDMRQSDAGVAVFRL